MSDFLNNGIKMDFGYGVRGHIFGGPFRNYRPGTRRLVGVKMAEEIDHPNDFSIPTRDFSVPDANTMLNGVLFALDALQNGNDVYAGCMGGIGRTGLFMGCMAKVLMDWQDSEFGMATFSDPVAFVRQQYKPHAIETEEQKKFVRNFDTAPAIAYLERLRNDRKPEPQVQHVPVFLSPWDWFAHKVFGVPLKF